MQLKQRILYNLLILTVLFPISHPLAAQDQIPSIRVNFEALPIVYAESENNFSPVYLLPEDELATRLTILDRWGSIIYESSEHVSEWNGFTNDHKVCQESTYFFCIEVVNSDGIRYKYWGELIMRHDYRNCG